MEQPTQFRSSLNGFNRQDVVRYMEFINNKHAAQVAQLSNELEYLRGKQDTLDAGRVAQLEKDLSAAQLENASLRQRVAELEKQLAGQSAAAPAPATAPSESELEAYRRAERVERVARERAKQLAQQAARALDQAGTQAEEAAAQIAQVSSQLSEQLARLQDAMDSGRRTLRETVGAVQTLADEDEA